MRFNNKKINRKAKRAQIMGMPFQFIFSVILIAVFLVAAVIVTKSLLKVAEHEKISSFYAELNSEINEVWYKTSVKTLTLQLPSSVERICFSNKLESVNTAQLDDEEIKAYNELSIYKSEDANFYFYPANSVSIYKISPYLKITCGERKAECLDVSGLPNNFYCIKNQDGIVTITIEKKSDDKSVRIKV